MFGLLRDDGIYYSTVINMLLTLWVPYKINLKIKNNIQSILIT